MIKRIIFDMDQTLLIWDATVQENYFSKILRPEDADKIIPNLEKYASEYEFQYKKYDIESFSKYLTERSGIVITKEFVSGWVDLGDTMETVLVPGIKETLEYLKSKNYSLVVLSNWFRKTQVSRLKKAGLLEYFEDVYGGEVGVKPHKDSYLKAIGEYATEECLLIGDDYIKDYLGPMEVGMKTILYDAFKEHEEVQNRIEDMRKLKEML